MKVTSHAPAATTAEVEPASTTILAVSLTVAMTAPSIGYLLMIRGGPGAVAVLGLFFIPLILILRQGRFDEAFARAIISVGGLVLIPPALSIGLHIESYTPLEMGYAGARILGTGLYMLTLACLAARPDAGEVLEKTFRLFAIVLLVMFVITAVLDGRWTWGRFSAGTAPANWWGEVFVAATLGAAFIKSRVVRYVLWGSFLVCTVLVMSRKSLLACSIIIGFATVQHEGLPRLIILSLVGIFILMPLAILIDMVSDQIDIFIPLYEFLYSQVFLLDNPTRGLGTGASGRFEKWALGLELIVNNPWFGVGFSRADFVGIEELGKLLHNGHIAIMSDLGIPFYILLSVAVWMAIYRALRNRQLIVAGYMLAFWVVQTNFSPRLVNLSILPMLFWMLVALMWVWPAVDAMKKTAKPAQRNPQRPQATAQPASPARPIGQRWRSAPY